MARMSTTIDDRPRTGLRGPRMLGLVALMLLLPVSNMAQQVLDLCGCAGDPTLQPFNAGLPSTYPPGTSGCTSNCSSGTITFTLPADGVLRFSSFTADGGFNIGFARNPANTPVTILVSGNVSLRGANGCCQTLGVNGSAGSSGTSTQAGIGGLGGNGAFRGGDGSAAAVNGASIGGTGLGPGGGVGGTGTPLTAGAGGTFFGVPELLPLLGGSGGGGGGSNATAGSCTGGGGGGGGGGLLIVANGNLTIQNYEIMAEGGGGGSVGNGTCATGAGGGAGGAIRLVGSRLVDNGLARLWIRGGSGGFNGQAGGEGRMRLESLDASAQTAFTPISGAPLRITGPSPVANPLSPTVRITAVGGQLPPAVPQGGAGAIDIVLSAPGVAGVDIATSGVPSGTTVLVTVKPRIGGAALSATVPLDACNSAGDCTATTAFNLSAGAYFVEARATFQVQ